MCGRYSITIDKSTIERRFNAKCRWYLTIISLLAYVFTKISVHLFAGAILMRHIAFASAVE